MRYWVCVDAPNNERFIVGNVYSSYNDGYGLRDREGYVIMQTRVTTMPLGYKFKEVPSNGYQHITVLPLGRKTIAYLLTHEDRIIRRAYCVCHEDDEYSFEVGAEIAMKRLFDKNYARSKKVDFSKCFFVGDKVEVAKPCYAELYDISFFAHENIDYFDDFLYGEDVEQNAFGTIVAKKGDMCLIDKATFKKGKHYILVNEKGLKKL